MFKLPPLPRTVRACEEDLRSTDPKVRTEVVVDLARMQNRNERERRIELLVGALSDPEPMVRRRALVSLADLSAGSAVPSILKMLSDPQIEVRQMAVLALGETADSEDSRVLGRLASLLNAGDASIRYQALLAHSTLRPEGAAEDLERACSDGDPEIRELALRLVDEILLGQDRDVPASLVTSMQSRTHDESETVRLVAQLLCAELRLESPRGMLERVVHRKFRVKEPRDEQSAVQLAGRLEMRHLVPALRRRAFGVFGVSLDPFRWVALGALGKLRDEAALDKLMKSLRSGNYVERTLAAEGLAESNHLAAVPLLRDMLGNEKVVDQAVLGAALADLSGSSALG